MNTCRPAIRSSLAPRARRHWCVLIVVMATCTAFASSSVAHAASAAGTTYRLQESAIGSVGDFSSSTNYGVAATGGEAVAANPSLSASSGVSSGLQSQFVTFISVSVGSSSVALGNISGTTASANVTVQTDGAGYTLLAQQNRDLLHTNLSTTIPAFGGTVASPTPWTNGLFGLGFTLTAATNRDAKWGAAPNSNYAGFPNSTTAIHTVSGYSLAPDTTTIEYRLNTSSTQLAGSYSNQVTYAAIAQV